MPVPRYFDTSPERRRYPRTKLAEIAYIGMGPENGGLVLDVSNGGLSFHTVAPVEPAEEIHFLLSLGDQSRIEGAGEVVWTDESKTVCGLRFTTLSSDALDLLNHWSDQSQTAAPASKKLFAPPPVAERALPAATHLARNDAPVFANPAVARADSTVPEAAGALPKPLLLWIVFALFGSALALTSFLYGVHVGKTEISSETQPAAPPEAQESPPNFPSTAVPAPLVSSGSDSVSSGGMASPPGTTPVPGDVASAEKDIFRVPPSPAPARAKARLKASKSGEAAPGVVQLPAARAKPGAGPDHSAGQNAENGKTELAAALAYLNGDNGRRDIPSAVRLLWAAVAKGNSEAEVMLADLYANGDGVAKDCSQARILLRSASISGNAQGQEKLEELNANGCQ